MKIIIDENYSLETDGFKGVTLLFSEERIKEKIDSKTKEKTGEKEKYIFHDRWYYPNPKLAILKYIELTQKNIEFDSITTEFKKISLKLDSIYEQFSKNNWRLK